MALTWATRVRFGRATSKTNGGTSSILLQTAYGSLGHRPGQKNAYFLELFYVLCFLVDILNLYFVLVFGPSVF
ncbi:hypothetical protein Hanom_Chr14g01259051 [Helianthus anomalus]